jgi:folate-binding protein YgfZ
MNAMNISPEQREQYVALTEGCGLVAFHDRTQIEITGRDRTTFLHNLCTNDVKRLEPGRGCEAYLTTVQGRTRAHVLIFCTPNSLIVETAAEEGPSLISHLEHYLVTEDVELRERTAEWCQWLLAGEGTPQLLHRLHAATELANACDHTRVQIDELPVWLRSVPWLQDGSFQFVTAQELADTLAQRLLQAGAVACDAGVFHMARLESGFPWFPWDVTDQNLPQEVGRNEQTLSLTKGCYLGQETVARLDSRGHINRILSGLRCETAQLPEAGTPLTADGKEVGRVTSAAYSPRLGAPLALAYVRVEHATPGGRLACPSGTAEVIQLPLRTAST